MIPAIPEPSETGLRSIGRRAKAGRDWNPSTFEISATMESTALARRHQSENANSWMGTGMGGHSIQRRQSCESNSCIAPAMTMNIVTQFYTLYAYMYVYVTSAFRLDGDHDCATTSTKLGSTTITSEKEAARVQANYE